MPRCPAIPVDPITLRDSAGNPHRYACNAQGLHVPLSTMTQGQISGGVRYRIKERIGPCKEIAYRQRPDAP